MVPVPANQPPQAPQPEGGECQGAWVQAGDGQQVTVEVTVGTQTRSISGYFDVVAPTNQRIMGTPFDGGILIGPDIPVTGTTVKDYPEAGQGVKFVEFGSVPPGKSPPPPGTSAGMTFTVECLPSGWNYAWCQIAEVGE